MLEVFSEVKTKYNLLRCKESLNKQLNDITSYMEFITALSNILKKEEGYEFFISEKANDIISIIINQNFINSEDIKEREEYIMSVMYNLNNYSKEEQKRQKNIYSQMKIDELGQPLFMQSEDFEKVIKSNYINLRKLKRIERDGNERTIKSLENDKTFLYLVNSLINEYPEVLTNGMIKLIKIVVGNSSRDKFDSVRDYLAYEIYKVTTLNDVNKLKKSKIKTKTL